MEKQEGFRGVVRRVEWRKEEPHTILTFTLEQRDEDTGNIYNNILVELRGLQVKGRVVDGNAVEVIGKIDDEGILIPKSIIVGSHRVETTKLLKMAVIPFIFFILYMISMMLNFSFGLSQFLLSLFIISSAIIMFVYYLKK